LPVAGFAAIRASVEIFAVACWCVCATAGFSDAAWVLLFAVSLLLQALLLLLATWLLQASLFLVSLLLVSMLLLGSWLLQASLLRLCAFAVSCRYTVGSLAAVLALAPK
jgi:hypothetical protein